MAPIPPMPALLTFRQQCLQLDGCLATTNTSHVRKLQQSKSFVKSLRLQKRLHRHTGCVNTVCWSDDGSLLVSGSDDCDINIWHYEQDLTLIHNITSGHTGNIFCAKFVPCMNNNLIVSCALDGNVRLTDVQRKSVHCIAKYSQRVHKIAFLPQSPNIFLTAGSDGTVRLFDLRCDAARHIRRTDTSNIVFDLRSHLKRNSIDISAISIHPLHGHLMALAGGDEYVRIADLRRSGSGPSVVGSTCVARFCPEHLLSSKTSSIFHSPHITGCQYDVFGGRIVATYSGDDIFIFDTTGVQPALPLNKGHAMAEVGSRTASAKRAWREDKEEEDDPNDSPARRWFCALSDEKDDSVSDDLSARRSEGVASTPVLQRLTGHRNEDTVKEVTFYGVDSEFVASGSDCGNIFIWDSHTGDPVTVLKEADSRTINCIAPNPHDATVIATCGIDDDIKIWKPDGMQSNGVELEEIAQLMSRNRWNRERAAPRITARQILQLFLMRESGGREFLQLLTMDALRDSEDEEEEDENDSDGDIIHMGEKCPGLRDEVAIPDLEEVDDDNEEEEDAEEEEDGSEADNEEEDMHDEGDSGSE